MLMRPQMSTPTLSQDAATRDQARLPAALAGSAASRSAFERSSSHPADPFSGKALISTRQAVAAGLGSRSKIQSLIRENSIETVKIGRSRLIVVESIRAMIAAGGV